MRGHEGAARWSAKEEGSLTARFERGIVGFELWDFMESPSWGSAFPGTLPHSSCQDFLKDAAFAIDLGEPLLDALKIKR
jgi:hypothetical protein